MLPRGNALNAGECIEAPRGRGGLRVSLRVNEACCGLGRKRGGSAGADALSKALFRVMFRSDPTTVPYRFALLIVLFDVKVLRALPDLPHNYDLNPAPSSLLPPPSPFCKRSSSTLAYQDRCVRTAL